MGWPPNCRFNPNRSLGRVRIYDRFGFNTASFQDIILSGVFRRETGSVEKYWGHRNKKHKKQPFSDASASHLSLVLWHV